MNHLTTMEVLLRLLTATVCGAAIGFNRDMHHKPAGLRTFALVSAGSAMMLLVIQMSDGDGGALSRVIQGVLTGIGFIGAGVILHSEAQGRVAGLTTAAAVWFAAGLGIASGLGLYPLVISGVVLVLLVLVAGKSAERWLARLFKRNALHDQNSTQI